MAKTGLSYYQAETDRFQDIKIKRLKKRYGCEGYAVYQYIQNEIYRVEGCYIRFTDDQMFDVSEYWSIDEARVETIIDYCAEVELFDAITWQTKRVLTSADIQNRYLEICRRAKKKVVIPEDIQLVEILQDTPSGSAPLPLFPGQEIETKTGKTTYGVPQMVAPQGLAAAGKESAAAGISASAISPQNSAEIRETPQNSAGNEYKEKESKENPSSIPPIVPPAREEEDKAPLTPVKSDGHTSAELRGNSPEEEYRRKLKHLGETCCSMGCVQNDLRDILLIENIALEDSPIWGLIEEMRQSGGRHTFYSYVIPSLRALIVSGRLHVVKASPEAVPGENEIKRMLTAIGVPSYDADALCKEAAGADHLLLELIAEIRKSKGKILMPAYFIRSRMKKARKNEIQKTA